MEGEGGRGGEREREVGRKIEGERHSGERWGERKKRRGSYWESGGQRGSGEEEEPGDGGRDGRGGRGRESERGRKRDREREMGGERWRNPHERVGGSTPPPPPLILSLSSRLVPLASRLRLSVPPPPINKHCDCIYS